MRALQPLAADPAAAVVGYRTAGHLLRKAAETGAGLRLGRKGDSAAARNSASTPAGRRAAARREPSSSGSAGRPGRPRRAPAERQPSQSVLRPSPYTRSMESLTSFWFRRQ